MKGEWRFAAMECGGLYMVGIGTVLMQSLFAGNLDYIKPTRVCFVCMIVVIMIFIILELSSNRSGNILFL